ncbi:HOOK protein [Rhizoctonia solani]|uniref:alpha-amylase n=2 Tax=Rhizoctonia solani TaxID=456999 RepID=A0A8H7LHN2_9AGAM|nr:HOOK protein [Rhizoctonia solani]
MPPPEIQQESQAFISWLSLFKLSRPVTSLADLDDGTVLFEVLSQVDEEYFHNPPRSQSSENWVIRFGQLKRLFRLITQYFVDVLRRQTAGLEVPDLQAIAQNHDVVQTLALCRLTIAISVQSKKNSEVIAGIQKLPQTEQRSIMTAIEKVMSRFTEQERRAGDTTMTDDDHYYQMQLERSRALAEKETLEKVYQQLLEKHRRLQTGYDDAIAEKDELTSSVRDMRRQMDDRRQDKSDGIMRAEIERLRAELQKTEENLSTAETEAERQTSVVNDLTRRVEELQAKADEAARLKDQVDEYRHAAEKLHKTENVMEKYKKKLEESADLRRTVKSLEEQNATLVDKNAALEEENRKVAAYKPLMESYKTQISELESKVSQRNADIEGVKFELSQSQSRLRQAMEERAKDSEALELYQERVRELELAAVPRPRIRTASTDDVSVPVSEPQTPALPITPGDDLDTTARGLGGELNDALTGTTMTDLKLQIRALKRDLEAARAGGEEQSRILVLESLLEDSQRMKSRYEEDYLTAHREKLALQAQLEEIRSGKAVGDGPEAAIALRQRLNETIEQLDTLRKEHAELQVKFETQFRDLTIAKSDLNLVNKDQLEILTTLRESVNEDKAALESEAERLKGQIVELKDKNKMQLEQVNALLMEKISLQNEGIGQREKMLERERHFGDLRASLGGKELPEEAKAKFLALHEETVQLKEQLKTLQEKYQKARAFIKDQDKLFKEQNKSSGGPVSGLARIFGSSLSVSGQATFEEAENHRSQMKILEEEVERYKRLLREAVQRYQQEQTLMLGIIQRHGMNVTRGHLKQPQRAAPSSWLGQQRKNIGQSLGINIVYVMHVLAGSHENLLFNAESAPPKHSDPLSGLYLFSTILLQALTPSFFPSSLFIIHLIRFLFRCYGGAMEGAIITDRFALPLGSNIPPDACDPMKQRYCGGTWNSIRENLDYIQNMGFTAIWISPVNKNIEGSTGYGESYHGYWIEDISQLNAHFGTADDLKALSAELHARGMYLMVDMVVNNVVAAGTTEPDLSSFFFKQPSQYHPYCPVDYKNQTSIEQCWMGDTKVALVDVNTEDEQVVSQYEGWVANFVQEYGIDGLRIDAAKHIRRDFWPGFCGAAGVFCIGEVYGPDIKLGASYQGPLDSILNFPLYYGLVQAFGDPKAANMSALVSVISDSQHTFKDTGLLGNFLENHDVPRWFGQHKDPQSLYNALAFSFMYDGIPVVYYGQEQYFQGRDDPANREPLWPSHYLKNNATRFIASLNQFRNFLVARSADPDDLASPISDWLHQSTQVLSHTEHDIVLARGPVISILTGRGSAEFNASASVLNSGYPSAQPLTEYVSIITCSQYVTGAGGALTVSYEDGGHAVVRILSNQLWSMRQSSSPTSVKNPILELGIQFASTPIFFVFLFLGRPRAVSNHQRILTQRTSLLLRVHLSSGVNIQPIRPSACAVGYHEFGNAWDILQSNTRNARTFLVFKSLPAGFKSIRKPLWSESAIKQAMSTAAPLVARVVVPDSQPRSPRVFIPLFIVSGLLVCGITVYLVFKLFFRLQKLRDEKRSESLKQELESGIDHSSVTCCGTIEKSKDLKLPLATFESEVEEIANHHAILSYDMFPPSPSTDISPARRSSSIFFFRSESLPPPARALLYPPSPRRASIPALWSNPRSKWTDENQGGYSGKARYPSNRPATSPLQISGERLPEENLQARRSVTLF